ncbi:MAG: hypothetical protein ACYDCC_09760 [Actinomycetota bacterium]
MTGWEPTHIVLRATRAWSSSDQAEAPSNVLEGLHVRTLQSAGDMIQVEFSNGWIGWMDKSAIAPIGSAPPANQGSVGLPPTPAVTAKAKTVPPPALITPVSYIGAGLALIGSFLPWLSAPGVGSFNAWRIPFISLFTNGSQLSGLKAGMVILIVALVALPVLTHKPLKRWVLIGIGSVPVELGVMAWKFGSHVGLELSAGPFVSALGGLFICYEFLILKLFVQTRAST